MKKVAFILCTVLLFASCVSQPGVPRTESPAETVVIPVIAESEAQDLVDSLLETIDKLIKTNARDKGLKELWNRVSKEINRGRIKFVVDTDSNSILTGAMFFIRDDNSIGISLSNGVLSMYKVRPSLAMAILIHELTHFYSYLLTGHRKFIELAQDRMERNWFEADAIHMEAVFIEECLAPLYELTPFEQFVLSSWQHDNIDSATILMTRESSETILVFISIFNAWWNRKRNLDETMQKVNEHILSYLNLYHTEKPNTVTWAMSVIALESCKYYFEKLVYTILEQQKSGKTMQTIDSFLDMYPDSREMYKQLVSIVTDAYSRANTIIDDFISDWESDHKKYIQVPQKQAA